MLNVNVPAVEHFLGECSKNTQPNGTPHCDSWFENQRIFDKFLVK